MGRDSQLVVRPGVKTRLLGRICLGFGEKGSSMSVPRGRSSRGVWNLDIPLTFVQGGRGWGMVLK